MGLLDGKKALIFGVANKNSIAWGIAQALASEGATVGLSYAMDKLERRVKPLAEEIGSDFVMECDVTDDDAMDRVFDAFGERYGSLDTLVHAVAFAAREDLDGRFVDISRDGFKQSMEISAYSKIAMAKRAEPLMTDGGSIMSLTYYAAEKVIPRYNAMAIAKASLELITRYLAADLGPQGIRVNTISAGPIKTLSAGGIQGFRTLMRFAEAVSPLRTLVSQDDVGKAALFLASDWSQTVTGEVLHVDAGYNILGYTATDENMNLL